MERSMPGSRESWQECIDAAGWFPASILHDLKNPLSTICAGSELLTGYEEVPSHVKQLATNIHRAAHRLKSLLSDLAHAASGQKSVIEACSVNEVIVAAAESAAQATQNKKVRVAVALPKEIEVPMVRSRMERVFFNLITNSFEAMPGGGKMHIGGAKSGNFVRIELEDDGPGIPMAIRDCLFEPFATAEKQNGLGLGLALSRQIVLDHGGDLWNEDSRGARFVMRLRLDQIREQQP
jgi:signal transduction histidine kinase